MPLDLEKIDLGSFGVSQDDSQQPDMRLRSTLSEAVKVNPDAQAKTNQLARDSGTPAFAVEQKPAEIETKLKLDQIDFSTMSKRSPNTAQFFTDFNNASIAHDDISVLESIESVFDFSKVFENIAETTRLSFGSQLKGMTLSGVDSTPARIQDLIPASAMPIGMELEAAQLSEEFAARFGITSDEQLQQARQEAEERLISELQDLHEERKQLTPEDMNLLEQGVRAGVESIVNMAPGVGLMVLSGGRAAPLLTTMGIQTYGEAYGQARADGLDPETANWYAGIDAAIEVGTEMLPTGTLERIITGKSEGLTKEALKFIVQEMGTEQLATLGQSINAYAFGLDEELAQAEDVQEMVDIQLRRQAVTAIATVVAGGTQAAAVSTVNRSIAALQRDEQHLQRKGEIEQEKIDQLNEAGTNSKLKQRDVEAFKQFINQADGEQNTTVFIDGAQASLYLSSKTRAEIDKDPALKLIADQVDEASRLGTDVAIPAADFAATVAGTPHFEALRDDMTLSADSISPFRAAEVQQETQRYVQDLINQAQENVSQYIEAQEIFTTVRDQLIDTGMVTPQNAWAMAQLVPAWATVHAQQNGMTVQEVYQRSGLAIEGPQTGRMAEVTGQVLEQRQVQDQEAAQDLISEIADFSQVSDDGLITVYHRTSKANADQIRRTGKMTPKEDGLFFSTKRDGEAAGFGDEVIEFRVPADQVQLDDIFDDEAHLRLPAKANRPNDVSDIMVQAAPLAQRPDGAPKRISKVYNVSTEDIGNIEAQLIRTEDGGAAIFTDKGVNEYNADFVKGKSDVELLAYHFEPLGFDGAKEVVEPTTAEIDGAPEARGYYDPANAVIRLTEAADLSTFLHEFAHFMYEMERKAGGETAQKIGQWFKRNADDVAKEAQQETASVTADDVVAFVDNDTTGDQAKDRAIYRAIHEQFARGFETYLMEGKAPSIELRNAFRSFARWLAQIYRAIKGQLNVNLDAEMRQVFDRLLATEEQIAAAEARARYEPMFTDAAMAGMTDEEFAAYQKRQEKVKDKQTETLRDKLIEEITRQTKAWWKEEKADLIAEETESLQDQPVYVAAARLRTGDIKLDRGAVREMAGVERTDKLGRKQTRIPDELRNMTASGGEGVHPDEAAAFFGYSSGDELITDLITAPKIQDLAESNAERRMREKYGDILNDGTIEQQADEAVQNEERGKLILDELKALSKGTQQPAFDRQTIKTIAEERIGQLAFREIFPARYRKAEIKAAQEAARMLAEGNREGAARAKARQVMNYYLGMAATAARNDTMSIVDRMARYNTKRVREAIQKAEGGYWDQIVKILSRFEFRKSATLKSVQDVNTWMRERIEQDGDGLVLSPEVLNETFVTHWKNVPHSQLRGIAESVKNIEHVARYANKITRLQEEMDFKELVQRWTDHMNQQPTVFKPQRADVVEQNNAKRFGQWAMAQMTKVPFLASWLDGGERAGMSHDILVRPFTDAYDAEMQLWRDVGTPVLEMLQNRDKATRKRHMRKIFIPEIKDADHDGNLFMHQVIAVALNTGNQSNLRKLLLGEGWANPDVDAEISFDNPKLQAVLKHMTREDWTMVQQIWDQMDKLYPQLAEVHRRTTGLVPPKVESTPIDTPFGTFKGGYYPVKYDPVRSHQAALNEDKLNAETESMFGQVGIQASVNASATNERTGYYGPIRLSLDVVPNHFQETIHYITHHDAVREANRLIRNKTVAETIRAKVGPAEYNQLKPWLNSIAKDGREAPTKTFIDSMLGRLRFGITLGAMGFKASTGIMQLFGLSNTVAEVGAQPVLQAARSILGSTTDIRNAWEFASENSKVLNHRAQTMDREIKNAMKALEGKKGILPAVQEASMKHIALIQTYMVDLPSWHAAYIKGMSEWGDEQRAFSYADWVIENIQGSGATKDLTALTRNQNEAMRMFTMFMTFFSSLWNIQRDTARGARSGRYSVTNVAAKMAFLFFIPVFVEMLMRGEFGGDEEPEEQLQGYLTNLVLYPVATVPFLRDVASGTIGEYGYNFNPVAQMMGTGVRSIPEIVERGFTDEEITKGQWKGGSKFIGAAVGVPGVNQAWATGEHLYDVFEEGEELSLRQLLFGPDRD